jgi:hypothetical protein
MLQNIYGLPMLEKKDIQMTRHEIYNGLRIITSNYIAEPKRSELLVLLDEKEAARHSPPGKGILACVSSDSNGIDLTQEHKELWDTICYYCI